MPLNFLSFVYYTHDVVNFTSFLNVYVKQFKIRIHDGTTAERLEIKIKMKLFEIYLLPFFYQFVDSRWLKKKWKKNKTCIEVRIENYIESKREQKFSNVLNCCIIFLNCTNAIIFQKTRTNKSIAMKNADSVENQKKY